MDNSIERKYYLWIGLEPRTQTKKYGVCLREDLPALRIIVFEGTKAECERHERRYLAPHVNGS